MMVTGYDCALHDFPMPIVKVLDADCPAGSAKGLLVQLVVAPLHNPEAESVTELAGKLFKLVAVTFTVPGEPRAIPTGVGETES